VTESPSSRDAPLPEYCVTRYPDSFAKDRYGMFWFVHDQCLYRAGYGQCLPVFAEDQVSPVIVKDFRVDKAMIDKRGNALVGSGTLLVIPPKSSPPNVDVKEHAIVGNRIAVTLGETAEVGLRYVWRADDGDWRESSERNILHIDPLADGPHIIEIFAIDSQLQVTPVPAKLIVTVTASAETLAAALQDLQSQDYAVREMAVKSLVAIGKPSLEPLRELRRSSDSSVQWWIDAAIEQIERK